MWRRVAFPPEAFREASGGPRKREGKERGIKGQKKRTRLADKSRRRDATPRAAPRRGCAVSCPDPTRARGIYRRCQYTIASDEGAGRVSSSSDINKSRTRSFVVVFVVVVVIVVVHGRFDRDNEVALIFSRFRSSELLLTSRARHRSPRFNGVIYRHRKCTTNTSRLVVLSRTAN